MGAFEVIACFAKNPGAAVTKYAPFTGQKLEVKLGQGKSTLQQVWAENKTGGILRIKSPRLHDDVQGIRFRVAAALPRLLMPYAIAEELYQTDTLEVEGTGGEAEVDVACLLTHYDHIEGSEGTLRSWAEIGPAIESVMGVEVKGKGGTEGKWGNPIALNKEMDLFKRPASYAILGYQVDAACAAVAVSGTDVGPLRHGGPGSLEPDLTSEWFIRLSEEAKEAAIPVFNSQNVGQVNVELATAVAEAERNVTLFCAKLRS